MDGMTQHGKDVNSPKLGYKFNVIPVKIAVRFLQIQRKLLKIYKEW